MIISYILSLSHVTCCPTLSPNATLSGKGFAWWAFGNQLFWFREKFLQIKSPAHKMFGAMATKMVAAWRVVMVCIWYNKSLQVKHASQLSILSMTGPI